MGFSFQCQGQNLIDLTMGRATHVKLWISPPSLKHPQPTHDIPISFPEDNPQSTFQGKRQAAGDSRRRAVTRFFSLTTSSFYQVGEQRIWNTVEQPGQALTFELLGDQKGSSRFLWCPNRQEAKSDLNCLLREMWLTFRLLWYSFREGNLWKKKAELCPALSDGS